MLRTIVFKDKAGNKLFLESGQLAVRNAEGEIINPIDTRKFLRNPKVKAAVNKRFGGEVRFKVLKPREKGKTKVQLGKKGFKR